MTTFEFKIQLATSWLNKVSGSQRVTGLELEQQLLREWRLLDPDLEVIKDHAGEQYLILELRLPNWGFEEAQKCAVQVLQQRGFLNSKGQLDGLRVVQYSMTEIIAAAAPADEQQSVLERFQQEVDDLIGGQEFKSFIRELCRMRVLLHQAGAESVLCAQRLLLAIGYGCGVGVCMEKLLQMARHCSLRLSSSCVWIELKAPAGEDDPSVIRQVQDKLPLDPALICLDITRWLSHTGSPSFQKMLRQLEADTRNSLVVFRVPYLDQTELTRVWKDLSNICFVRRIEIPPLTNQELREAACRMLAEQGFSMESSAAALFDIRIMEHRQEGNFYGFQTVRKIVNEMIYQKLWSQSGVSVLTDTCIHDTELRSFQRSVFSNKTGQQLLDEMVGLTEVKIAVQEMIDGIQLRRRLGQGPVSMHMCFKGNPGTGKTTVAEAIGRLLKEQGVLSVGNYYPINARQLCGRTIGETAPKTAEICRGAYGSVLFIDEAYSLLSGDEHSRDFGREALSTLISEMENNRDRLVVIFAGYPREMDRLLAEGNVGLRGRFKRIIEFRNYTPEELLEIFERMVRPPLRCEEGYRSRLLRYFQSIPAASDGDFTGNPQYSNARMVRNLYERLVDRLATRQKVSGDTSSEVTLSLADLELLLEEREFAQLSQTDSKRRITGFQV